MIDHNAIQSCPHCGQVYVDTLPEWCQWWYNPFSPTKGREWKEAYDMATKQAAHAMMAKWNGRRHGKR
tara:strand:+ start:1486 stop:1689 length:204 start_codon:yes stop_codon:yes gene_type:complete